MHNEYVQKISPIIYIYVFHDVFIYDEQVFIDWNVYIYIYIYRICTAICMSLSRMSRNIYIIYNMYVSRNIYQR